MKVKKLNRSIFQRILGRPATSLPENNDFCSFSNGKITVELSQSSTLANPGGAVRLEGDIPKNILVVHSESGKFLAIENKCTHMGRCVDPVPGTETVQCCSVNAATYDYYDGKVLDGPAKKPLQTYPVMVIDGRLVIEIGKNL